MTESGGDNEHAHARTVREIEIRWKSVFPSPVGGLGGNKTDAAVWVKTKGSGRRTTEVRFYRREGREWVP